MIISTNIHLLRPVFTMQRLYTQFPRSESFIFKMVAMLQIPRVFPRVSYLGGARAVQCPCTGPKIGDKSQQIPCYSPLCPRGQPPMMAADKCITRGRGCLPFTWRNRLVTGLCKCAYHLQFFTAILEL